MNVSCWLMRTISDGDVYSCLLLGSKEQIIIKDVCKATCFSHEKFPQYLWEFNNCHEILVSRLYILLRYSFVHISGIQRMSYNKLCTCYVCKSRQKCTCIYMYIPLYTITRSAPSLLQKGIEGIGHRSPSLVLADFGPENNECISPGSNSSRVPVGATNQD